MTQLVLPGHLQRTPMWNRRDANTLGSTVLNATGETLCMIGYVTLENPLSGSKTLSAAGGGKIVWRSASVTFANGSSTFDVGIQDVSTAAAPGRGDGTFDVKASFTGGGGGITANAANTSTMTSGTKTIAQGDLVALTFAMTVRAGTDVVTVSLSTIAPSGPPDPTIPFCCDNTGGSYARNAGGAVPNAYIVFDDGTVGWIYGCAYVNALGTVAFNSTTGTADEYGNIVYPRAPTYAMGLSAVFSAVASPASAASMELILYSDPLGTPVAERVETIESESIGSVAGELLCMFTTPFLMRAYTSYALTVRPTTNTNWTLRYHDNHTTAEAAKTGAPNANCYAVRRLNNSGAFSDYNGGTAKTRAMTMWLHTMYVQQNYNQAGWSM